MIILQIVLKKFLWLKKSKNTVPWTNVKDDLNGIEELIKKKGGKLFVIVILLIIGLILLSKMSYFPEPHSQKKKKNE